MFRQHFNGCKTMGCPNMGGEEPSLYRYSERLGYLACYCPSCGAYPPVLEDQAIIQLLAQHYQDGARRTLARCAKCAPDFFKPAPKAHAFGYTTAGSARRQCSHCGTHFTLLNNRRLQQQLLSLFLLLQSGIPPSQWYKRSGLNSNAFYSRLQSLAAILRHYSRLKELRWLDRLPSLALQSRSHPIVCRSGSSHRWGTALWQLFTCDSLTGYQLLHSHNLLFNAPDDQLGRYRPTAWPEVAGQIAGDLLAQAEAGYQRIFSRPQFDELVYCQARQTFSNEGVLLRPVYAAHAHFQLLTEYLRSVVRLDLLLEHESFLRGAAMWACHERIKAAHCDIFYLYHKPRSHQDPPLREGKRLIGWWQEKWQQREHHWQGKSWDIAYASLTSPQPGPIPVQRNPDWNQVFFDSLDSWLPTDYRRRLKCSTYLLWLELYRFRYNYLLESRLPCSDSQPESSHDFSCLIDYINGVDY